MSRAQRLLRALMLGALVTGVWADAASAQTSATRAATGENWNLPDRLVERLDAAWSPSRGAYVDRGGISIRANAMLMEVHALAALAGHTGSARRDERLPSLVKLFTTPPVYVTSTKTKRGTASFPHVPAWESVYTRDSERAVLHPSADAIIARSLATAWRARLVAGLPSEDSDRIQRTVGAVAGGKWYRAPTRAENQINWNTDVYAADFEVNGNRSRLPDYRAHLKWFVDHAFKPAYKGGSSNLSRGYGFRYLPQVKGGGANQVDTLEYANLVHSSLGFYATAVRAGMRPLSATQVRRLQSWTRHLLYGAWTHAGYLNWDTGLGTSRRHIQQYWAFALDALIKASGPGGLVATPRQRAYVRQLAEQGLALYSRIGWDTNGALPGPMSFGAPNGFPKGTRSALITPLRFAIIAAELDVRLPGAEPRQLPNTYSHDGEFGRLAVSTPRYNTAVIKPVSQGEGGLEPSRLFDGRQRPLTTLGAGSYGGPAPGVRLTRFGSALLDTQPGTQRRGRVPSVGAGGRRNTAGTFTTLGVAGAVRSGTSAIRVRHTFRRDAFETSYRITRGRATNLIVRMPVWGRDSTITLLRGARVRGKRIVRSGSGVLLFRGQTADGATMLVALRGLPKNARIRVVRVGRSGRAPAGARQVEISFSPAKQTTLRRRIAIVQP